MFMKRYPVHIRGHSAAAIYALNTSNMVSWGGGGVLHLGSVRCGPIACFMLNIWYCCVLLGCEKQHGHQDGN